MGYPIFMKMDFRQFTIPEVKQEKVVDGVHQPNLLTYSFVQAQFVVKEDFPNNNNNLYLYRIKT